MSILKLRTQLRRDRVKKIDELTQVEKKISENEIDVLIAKIKYVVDKSEKSE